MFHISDLLGLIPQRELQSYDRYRNKHGERSLARCSLRNDVTDFCTLTCWCLQWVIRISASAVNVCNHIYPYIHCQHCTKHKLSKKYHRFPCFFFFFVFFLTELQPDRLCQNPFFILQVQKDNIHSCVAEAAPLCVAFLGWVISSGLFYEIGIKELTAKVMSLKPVWMSVIWNAFSKWQIWWNSMTSCSQCL